MLVSSLVILLIVETAFIAAQYFRTGNSASSHPQFPAVAEQSFVVPYFLFNRPISNGTTEYHLPEALNHSWVVTVQSHLQSTPNMQTSSLAEIALAPEYPVENRSIPTIIIQERGTDCSGLSIFLRAGLEHLDYCFTIPLRLAGWVPRT